MGSRIDNIKGVPGYTKSEGHRNQFKGRESKLYTYKTQQLARQRVHITRALRSSQEFSDDRLVFLLTSAIEIDKIILRRKAS